jgi:tetratricopeptide (TPR) repeat protein
VKKKRAILVIFLSCLLALAFLAFFGIRRTGIEALQSRVSQNLKNGASSGQVMSFLDVQQLEHTRLIKAEFTQLGGNQNVIEAIKRNTWIGLLQKESIRLVFVFNESHELVRFDLYPVYTGLEISEKQQLKLTGDGRQRLTNRYTQYEYADAYQLYHKGLYYFYESTPVATMKAREYFQQAIDKDPFYPQAYAGLAGTYVYLSELPPQEAMPKAKTAARKALELDGGLAETHVSMGWVSLYYDWDWVAAGKHFERAIALNPNSPLAHFEYANYLSALGRSNESITETQRGLDLDPVSPSLHSGLAFQLYASRRFDRAIEQYRKTLELDPSFPPARFGLGFAYAAKGMYRKALAEFEKLPLDQRDVCLAYVHARMGETGQALRILDELKTRSKQSYVPASAFAMIYLGLEDKDQAFTWLEKAYEERSFRFLASVKVDPLWDPLRSDPRFADLLCRLSLPQ